MDDGRVSINKCLFPSKPFSPPSSLSLSLPPFSGLLSPTLSPFLNPVLCSVLSPSYFPSFAVSLCHIPSPCSNFIKLLPFFLIFSLPHFIFSLSPSATFSFFFFWFSTFFLSSLSFFSDSCFIIIPVY
jgi:hypothetical protein